MALTKVTGQVIKNTTDVTVGVLTVTNTLAVGGTVSIGGTLTYEDVTNVDAVGLITARNGIVVGSGITLSKDGDIFATGVCTATSFVGSGANLTGVASTENIRTNTNATFLQNVTVVGTSTVTGNIVPSSDSATDIGTNSVRFQNAYVDTYYGDGSNLTGITGTTINSNADNRIITGSGTANTLNGESELTYSTYLNLTRANTDTNFGDNSAPGGTQGIFVSNSQSTNGVFSALTLSANDVNSTNQSASFIAKSVSGGYSPEVHISSRTASNTNESNFKITSSREVEVRYQGSTKLKTTNTGVDVTGNVNLIDQGKLMCGDGDDLQIDHSGTNSQIYHNGTGHFYIEASGADEILYLGGDDKVTFRTNSTTVAYFDANGRLGINPDGSGPDKLLHVSDNNNAGVVTPFRLTNVAGSSGTEVRMELECGVDEIAYIGAKNEGSDIGPLMFATATSQAAYPSEKMRLTNDGRLLVHTTTSYNGYISSYAESGQPYPIAAIGGNTSQGLIGLYYSTSLIGSITVAGGGSSVAYNTSSDYRLKENEVTISDSISRVKQLKPYTFNFKTNPDEKIDGFFAHEAQEVTPYAVTGEKDAVEEDGSIKPQSVDYAKLTPLLTAALQEAIAKIETLESEVSALKSS